MMRFGAFAILVVLAIGAPVQAQTQQFIYQLGSAIHLYDTASHQDKILLDDQHMNMYPALSPDLETVVFTSNRSGPFDLYLLVINTGAITQITSTVEEDIYPSWSPDGTKIAYAARGESSTRIVIYELSSGTSTDLISDSYRNFGPAWAPDGDQLAYTSNRKTGRPLFLADANTGSSKLVSNEADIVLFPRWSPNGEKIAYRSGQDGQIYVLDIDTLEQTQITDEPETGNHAWQSNELILYQASLDSAFIIDINGKNRKAVQIQLPDGEFELALPMGLYRDARNMNNNEHVDD